MFWYFFIFQTMLAVVASCIFDMSDFNWKAIDIASLGFGSVGILSAVGEADRIRIENQVNWKRPTIASTLLTLESNCVDFVSFCQTRLNNSNLASEHDEYLRAKSWFEEGIRFRQFVESSELPDLLHWLSKFPIAAPSNELLQCKKDITATVERYQTALEELKKIQNKTERSPLEVGALQIAPYFISFAIGLSLLKILNIG